MKTQLDAARQRLAEIKALEDKPAAKLLRGIIDIAILEARRVSRDRSSPEYRAAVYKSVRDALEEMPFDVVQNNVRA